MKVQVVVPNSPYGFCVRKATFEEEGKTAWNASQWHFFNFYCVQICKASLSGHITKSGSSESLGVLMALPVLAKRFCRDASCVICCFLETAIVRSWDLSSTRLCPRSCVLARIEFQEVEEKGGLLRITLHCHHQNDSALTWAAIWPLKKKKSFISYERRRCLTVSINCACACACVCVIVKSPALPPCAVDGCYKKNPFIIIIFIFYFIFLSLDTRIRDPLKYIHLLPFSCS